MISTRGVGFSGNWKLESGGRLANRPPAEIQVSNLPQPDWMLDLGNWKCVKLQKFELLFSFIFIKISSFFVNLALGLKKAEVYSLLKKISSGLAFLNKTFTLNLPS
ncbi:hypothetical protein KKF38_00190 [Patescibacteria group bacterium]|nr:hypothetical protein [Patescibacteria group bacterium]